ncbi:MAG: AAA family ATPase [Acholeplasmataceae bacterium]|jgi:predicted ATP-dependent endonuclease of OLD family|nr:AAA family ATPase [Acholeplasmataceae bacterium]
MKIGKIKIINYRSLYNMESIPVSALTVIVGKNNQGKSNFIKAIEVAFEAIASSVGIVRYRRKLTKYDYERDFPMTSSVKSKNTELTIQFDLDKNDTADLYYKTGMVISNYITTRIVIDNLSKATVTHGKRGAKIDAETNYLISDFILENVSFINIHAIRTENDSLNVIDQLIQDKIQSIENDDEYVKAKELILRKEKEALKEISRNTCQSLKTFLPEVKSVDILLDEFRGRYTASSYRRRFSVKIDDGILTDLEYKGDGIKSLSALALLNDTSNSSNTAIVAIEEPESHLHSGAIHNLNEILKGISKSTQLFVTSHNPLFINRSSVDSNVIISKNTAVVARNIAEIRTELGVQAADNLINAELVIIVEGESDSKIIRSILSHKSSLIKDALIRKRAIINHVGGASKINSDVIYYKQMLCNVFVILDKDSAGTAAIRKAITANILKETEYFLLSNTSGREAEIEDMINPSIYSKNIKELYGVDILETAFRGSNKWSKRISDFFSTKGKLFDNEIEKKIKILVAESVEKNPDMALISHYEQFFDCIVKYIEDILNGDK